MASIADLSTEDLQKMLAAHDAAPDISKIPTEQLMRMKASDSPTGSFLENAKAASGKIFYDVARGAGQRIREAFTPSSANAIMQAQGKPVPKSLGDTVGAAIGAPTEQEIADTRQLERPLMATGGGKVGAIATGAALAAPTVLMPGANTAMGAALTGGLMGALQPTAPGESAAKNTAIGTAIGGATQVAAGAIGRALQSRAASRAADAARQEAQNAPRDAALAAGREAGYVVPPATAKPNLVNEAVESVGGKVATAQAASLKNQDVTNTLAREYLGMKPDAIMSKAAIADAKNVAAAPYREIAKVSPEAQKALEAWKQANFDAKMQWNYFRKSGNPEAFKAAQAAGESAEKALNDIEAHAAEKFGPAGVDFVDALKAARVQLGKLSTVESAMTSGGNIDAKLIAKMGERIPFKDQLRLIADFAGNFPKAVATPEKIGGMSHFLRPGIGATIGTAIGGPVGTAIGAATGVAGPWSVRQALLSGAGQRALATPSYGGGALTGTVADLLASRTAGAALPAATVRSILQNRSQ